MGQALAGTLMGVALALDAKRTREARLYKNWQLTQQHKDATGGIQLNTLIAFTCATDYFAGYRF